MSEYRHIANLAGPQGPQGERGPQGTTEPRGTLSAETNIEDLDYGLWAVQSTQVANGIGLPGPRGSIGYLEKIKLTDDRHSYRYTTLDRGDDDERHGVWTRGMDLDGNLLPDWKRIYPDTRTPGTSAPGAIRALAAQDGWLACYDPTDTEGIQLSVAGYAQRIEDSLGNLPPMLPTGNPPQHRTGVLGQLSGTWRSDVSNYLQIDFGGPMSQQLTVVTVAQQHTLTPGQAQFLFDGMNYDNRTAFISGGVGYYAAFDGLTSPLGIPVDTSPHVIAAVFDGPDTHSIIDGQLNHYGSNRTTQMIPAGLNIGANYQGTSHWQGTIGPVLLYLGRPPQDVLNRMTDLLHSLTGIARRTPTFSPETRVFSTDAEGNETFRVGDPDAFGRSTAQSLMKMMTCYTARQHLSDNELDEQVEIHPDDVNNNIWRAGDLISYRDLMYSAALPSSNAAPATIARHVGQMLLDSDGSSAADVSPRMRFVLEMEEHAADLGFDGASFRYPWSQGLLTPRHLVELMRLICQDSALKEIFGARTRNITFGGPEARTTTITHTIESNAPHPLHFTAGKTGTGFGVGHLVVAWEHPDGTEHYTAIMDTDRNFSERRYREFWKAQAAVISGGGAAQKLPGGTSDTERTTLPRDISHLVGAERSSADEGVFITRMGQMVTITFNDAQVPADLNQQSLLPVGLRPGVSATAELVVGRSTGDHRVSLRVFPGGSLRVYGNDSGDALNGSLTYQVESSRFVSSPFIGAPVYVDEGPG